jgi:hypothetical protein
MTARCRSMPHIGISAYSDVQLTLYISVLAPIGTETNGYILRHELQATLSLGKGNGLTVLNKILNIVPTSRKSALASHALEKSMLTCV